MNAKNAKEIVALHTCSWHLKNWCNARCDIAESFLEGHKSAKKEMIEKFKPVVEALEKIGGYHKPAAKIARDALKSYRREVLGEKE